MSMNGKSAPTMSATTVMSSAMRVIESCQRAFAARRIADNSVPAWLMPMKKTKFEMYRPQEMRSRMPVTSRPFATCVEYA